MLTIRTWLVVLAVLVAAVAPAARGEVQGQRPVPLVDGTHQLVSGTWAEYGVRDLRTNTAYRLRIDVLERAVLRGKAGVWLELGVTPTNSAAVLTRVFCEETTNGLGRARRAIVQVEGSDPFVVPGRHMGGGGEGRGRVGDFRRVSVVTNSVDELMNWKGRDITVRKLEARDDDGRVTEIIATSDVPPLGIVLVRAPSMEMNLEDWGDGAASRITGKPIGFTRWLWRQFLHPARAPAD